MQMVAFAFKYTETFQFLKHIAASKGISTDNIGIDILHAIERFNKLSGTIQEKQFIYEKRLLNEKNHSLITQAFEAGNADTIMWLFNNQNFKPDKKTVEVAANNRLHIDDFKKLVDLFDSEQAHTSKKIDWGGNI